MKNASTFGLSKVFAALIFCVAVVSGSARAEKYEITEFKAATEPYTNSKVEYWSPGENVFNNPFFQEASREAEISVSPGQIILDGFTYYQRKATLFDVFTAHPHFESRQDRFDPSSFPLSSRVAGPLVSRMLAIQPSIADSYVFIKSGSSPDGLFSLLLPVGSDLIQIDYETVELVGDMVGSATLRILLYQPGGVGYVFSEADVEDDLLGEGLVFTEEEVLAEMEKDRFTFTEEDVKRFIEEENEDLLKILGCAAGLRDCPYGLDPDAVRAWMQIDENPADLLGDIVNERRAEQQEAQE